MACIQRRWYLCHCPASSRGPPRAVLCWEQALCLALCHPLAPHAEPRRVSAWGVVHVPWRWALGLPGSGCLWTLRHMVLMRCLVIFRSSGTGVYGELTPTSPCFGSELGGTGVRLGAIGLACCA